MYLAGYYIGLHVRLHESKIESFISLHNISKSTILNVLMILQLLIIDKLTLALLFSSDCTVRKLLVVLNPSSPTKVSYS